MNLCHSRSIDVLRTYRRGMSCSVAFMKRDKATLSEEQRNMNTIVALQSHFRPKGFILISSSNKGKIIIGMSWICDIFSRLQKPVDFMENQSRKPALHTQLIATCLAARLAYFRFRAPQLMSPHTHSDVRKKHFILSSLVNGFYMGY